MTAAGAPQGAVLSVRDLNKSFGRLPVTCDVSLELGAGARHALIGPNGAGKTTLVHQITGVLKPSSGSIAVMGQDVTRWSPQRRVKLGMVRTFQINSLFRRMTVLENVCIALLARRGRDATPWGRVDRDPTMLADAEALLTQLSLQDLAGRRIDALAYGQQRLVEIALALALKPAILLLDAPAAGVSTKDSALLLDTLRALPREIAVLIIEHDMNLVFQFAERLTVLVGGRILTEGTGEEIRRDERVRDVYLGRKHHA